MRTSLFHYTGFNEGHALTDGRSAEGIDHFPLILIPGAWWSDNEAATGPLASSPRVANVNQVLRGKWNTQRKLLTVVVWT